MRLLTDICREVRYFSKRKSHPSGARAPITNTAIVMSTGRLWKKRDGFYYLKHCLVVFILYLQMLKNAWPHGAIWILPLVKELGGFGYTWRMIPDASEQQQVTPQHSLRHGTGVTPFLTINQIPEKIHNVTLRHNKRSVKCQCAMQSARLCSHRIKTDL